MFSGLVFGFLGFFVWFGFFNKPIALKPELCTKSSHTAVEGTSSHGNTNKISKRQHKLSIIIEETISHFKLILIQSCSGFGVSVQCLE